MCSNSNHNADELDSVATSHRPKVRRRHISGRSKSGCLTCRGKKVKCDEGLPSCHRCLRLKLDCQQPFSRMPRHHDNIATQSPFQTRWSPSILLPLLPRGGMNFENDKHQPTSELDTMRSTGGLQEQYDRHSLGINSVANPSVLGGVGNSPIRVTELPMLSQDVNFDTQWLFPFPSVFEDPFSWEGESEAIPPSMIPSVSYILNMVPQTVKLNKDEEQAIVHFATEFSLSQTTRDPQWSTPTLILREALYSSRMLLHSILAVSLLDLTVNKVNSSEMRQFAQEHYGLGTKQLVQALQSEICPDQLGVLGTFYCIYKFMSQQQMVNSLKINQLSITALDHIKKHELHTASATINTTPAGSTMMNGSPEYGQRSLLARLTLWLLKLDAQCSFYGCKSSLAEYFESYPEKLSGIQGLSRIALQLNWKDEYPISQSIRDIESCLPVDMLMELSAVMYLISSMHELIDSAKGPRYMLIKERLIVLEVVHNPRNSFNAMADLTQKYASVFYYGSSDMTLQPAMKVNCATSATMFYALRIYLEATIQSSFSMLDNATAQHALSKLLLFAQHVCPAGVQQPLYEFQWSLFIACLINTDGIYQQWIQARISDTRFKKVLQRILTPKTKERGLSLDSLRQMLRGMN